MKKLTNFVAAIALLFSTTAFALGGDTVPAKVKAAFLKDFTGSTDVTWEKTGDFYAARFMMNGSIVKAVYKEGGELSSASRTIGFHQLPLAVALAVKQKYEGYIIADKAREVNMEGVTLYYITVENDQQTILLKAYTSGELSTESKSKK